MKPDPCHGAADAQDSFHLFKFLHTSLHKQSGRKKDPDVRDSKRCIFDLEATTFI